MAKTVESTLATLKGLQSVDDQLSQLRTGVAALTLRVDAHKKRVAELEANLKTLGEGLKVEEKASAMKDLDLKVIGEKIAKLREQLNTLTSNKAYATMVGEIGGHEAERGRVEEDALQVMEKVETARALMEGVRAQIREAHEAVKREEAAIADEVRGLSRRIRELSAERQGLCSQLDLLVADRYEKIARSKQGKGIVAVKDGACQGCFMGVTKQMILRLWSKKELVSCPNCARLIYLEGEVQ
jgi:hypothetical protein